VKSVLLAAILLATAAQTPNPLARFSYSAALAERMNARYGVSTAPLFLADEAAGRASSDPLLLDAIHALIRVFPACGSRQLHFAYAYGQDATAHLVAFEQAAERAPKCPAAAVVAIAPGTGAVTVRSFPEA
jgi:hypothetical protein